MVEEVVYIVQAIYCRTGPLGLLVAMVDLVALKDKYILAAFRVNLSLGFPTRSHTNQAVQPQNMA